MFMEFNSIQLMQKLQNPKFLFHPLHLRDAPVHHGLRENLDKNNKAKSLLNSFLGGVFSLKMPYSKISI